MGSKRKRHHEPDPTPAIQVPEVTAHADAAPPETAAADAAPSHEAPANSPLANVHVELKGDAPPAVQRDAGAIDVDALPERPFPDVKDARHTRFQAVFKSSVLNAIKRHGASKPDVEVCGVMVGNVYRDKAGPYLYIEAIIRGDHAANRTAQVTFTAETWQHIHERMETKHPNQKILGWYHTHPGFGIFLSKMDLFIHENFFNLPWQTAFVHDPKSGENGLFVWREGVAENEKFLVEEDGDGAPDDEEAAAADMPPAAAQAAAQAEMREVKLRVRKVERHNRMLMFACMFLLLIAVAWPFVLFTIKGSDPRLVPIPREPKQPVATTGTSITNPPSTNPVLAAYTISPAPLAAKGEPGRSEKNSGFAADLKAITLQPATMPSVPVETVVTPVTPVTPVTVSQAALIPAGLIRPVATNPSEAPVVRTPMNDPGNQDWIAFPKPEVIRPVAGGHGVKVLESSDSR